MDYLAAEEPRAHFAESTHRCAFSERFCLARVEIEKAQHHLAGGVPDPAQELSPGTVHNVGRAYRAFHLDGQAGRSARNRGDACLVLVTQGQVKNEIEIALNSEARELRLK